MLLSFRVYFYPRVATVINTRSWYKADERTLKRSVHVALSNCEADYKPAEIPSQEKYHPWKHMCSKYTSRKITSFKLEKFNSFQVVSGNNNQSERVQ